MFRALVINKYNKLHRIIISLFLSVLIVLPVVSASAEAAGSFSDQQVYQFGSGGQATTKYDSWLNTWDSTGGWATGDTYDGISGIAGDESDTDNLENTDDDWMPGIFESVTSFLIRETVGSILVLITDSMDISIEKVVYGRVATGKTGDNFYLFGLEDGNIYGGVGAILYAIFRNFIFAVFAIQYVWMLGSFLLKGTGKGRADLKSSLVNFVFMFALLYAMPLIVDAIIYIRDVLLKLLTEMTSGITGNYNLGVTDIIITATADDHTIVGAILLCCMVGGTLFFVFSYIKIALQQTYLFGVFPIVTFRSFTDRQILNKWIGQFITGLFVPVFDAVGLWMVILIESQNANAHDSGPAILGLIVFISIIPCRNLIMQLFGMPIPGRGFSLAAAALMMMRFSRAGGGKGKERGTPDEKNEAPAGKDEKPIESTNGRTSLGESGNSDNTAMQPEQDALGRDGTPVAGIEENSTAESEQSMENQSSNSSSVEKTADEAETFITEDGTEVVSAGSELDGNYVENILDPMNTSNKSNNLLTSNGNLSNTDKLSDISSNASDTPFKDMSLKGVETDMELTDVGESLENGTNAEMPSERTGVGALTGQIDSEVMNGQLEESGEHSIGQPDEGAVNDNATDDEVTGAKELASQSDHT